MARSLLTGEFPGRNDEDDEDATTAPEEVARPHDPAADARDRPAVSDSFTLSSSSVVLPGRSRDGSQSKSRKPTYWQSVASIGIQVAEALEYAHKQGVQHRDIKPSNLLLDTQGTVWVTDFGLAKAEDQPNLTHTGDILGTLRYMPPEAFEGKTDARGDVYSLGLTLYEMLAFRPAFDEKERNRLIKQVTQEEPPRLGKSIRSLPRDLETIVSKAIDREPGRRYQTAAELADDLQRFVDDEPIRARRASPAERLGRWCRRNPVVAGLAAALVLVVLIGFAGVTWKWREAEWQADLARAAETKEAEQRAIAERQADRATAEADRSRRLLYGTEMSLAQQAWDAGDTRPRPGAAGEAGAPRRPGGPAPLRMALPEGTLPRRQPADAARAHGRHHGGRLLARRQDPGHGRREPEHPVVGRRLAAHRQALGVGGQCPRVLAGWQDPRDRPHGRQSGFGRAVIRLWDVAAHRERASLRGMADWPSCQTWPIRRTGRSWPLPARNRPSGLGCRHASNKSPPSPDRHRPGPQRRVFARRENPGLRGLRQHGAALGRRRAARRSPPWKGTRHGSNPWPSHRMARPWPRPAPTPPCGSGTWPPPPDRRGSFAGTDATSIRSPSRPTARSWPRAAARGPSGSGTPRRRR